MHLHRTSITVQILFLCNMYTAYGAEFLIPDMMSYGYCYMSEWFDAIYTTKEGCINYTKVSTQKQVESFRWGKFPEKMCPWVY